MTLMAFMHVANAMSAAQQQSIEVLTGMYDTDAIIARSKGACCVHSASASVISPLCCRTNIFLHNQAEWRKLEHVTGACSEHAKTKKYTQRRGAWGDAHRAAGDAPRERHRSHVVASVVATRQCDGPTAAVI